MMVSAISMSTGLYKTNYNTPKVRRVQQNDTSFNSLTSYAPAKPVNDENMPQVYGNINEWKNFCQNQILGKKLNVIA